MFFHHLNFKQSKILEKNYIVVNYIKYSRSICSIAEKIILVLCIWVDMKCIVFVGLGDNFWHQLPIGFKCLASPSLLVTFLKTFCDQTIECLKCLLISLPPPTEIQTKTSDVSVVNKLHEQNRRMKTIMSDYSFCFIYVAIQRSN